MTAPLTEIPLRRLDGSPETLGQYGDKVLLVVNVASRCGLTPQYEKLEALQKELGGANFTVLGFPANDFAGQEPGSNAEIASYCSATYGVTFPMFEKGDVTGPDKQPLYEALLAAAPECSGDGDAFRENLRGHGITPTQDPEVLWNFEKFLIGKGGNVVGRFAPTTEPDDPTLRAAIDAELAK
jgi:glutathione peroxidase